MTAHDLARLRERTRKAEPIDHVIESALEEHQQIFAGDTVHPFRLLEVRRELPFHESVDAFYLLLFTEPNREFGKAGARLPMRAGRIIASLDSALVAVASLSLEEEFQSLAPA